MQTFTSHHAFELSAFQRWQSRFVGILIAIYLVAGRWGFDRFLNYNNDDFIEKLLELRLWSVGCLLVMSTILLRGKYRNRVPFIAKSCLIFICLFFLYLVCTAIWAPWSDFVSEKMYDLFVISIATFCIYFFFSSHLAVDVWDGLLIGIVITTLPLAAIALMKSNSPEISRLAVLGGGPIIFGRLMGLLCLTAIHIYFKTTKSIIWVPIMFISLLLVVLSGSRGAMVALAISIFIYLLLAYNRLSKNSMIPLLFLLVLIALINYTYLGEKIITVFQSRMMRLLIEQQYAAGRDTLYANAYNLGLNHFWLGAGLASFPANGLGVYPHNILLEAFSEAGIIGVMFVSTIISHCVVYFWKYRKTMNSYAMSVFILLLIGAQFSGDLFDNRSLYVFLLAAMMKP